MAGLNVDVKSFIIGAIVLLLVLYGISPEFRGMVQSAFTQSPSTETVNVPQNVLQEPQANVNQGVGEMPQYQIASVKIKYLDYFSRDGIAGLTVEALNVPSHYTYEDLKRIAQDPNRVPLATATTDENGIAEFTNVITTGVPTLYVVRNGTQYYEDLRVLTVPVPSKEFAISTYQFPGAIFLYPIGSFKTIGTDVDASTDDKFNVSKTTSGIQYYEITITIGENDAGKALKNPVLVIRTPDDATPLAPGMIKSLYIIHESGTDFGIPVTDLKSYINGPAIRLSGSLTDERGNTYMTVSDSGTYKVKITWDASKAQAGNEIDIVLDDLGAYRGTTEASLQNGASPEVLSIKWEA